jgi:hypothetical protein
VVVDGLVQSAIFSLSGEAKLMSTYFAEKSVLAKELPGSPAPCGSTPTRCVASVPFGGYRASGLGRENGLHGRGYLETKAVWVELASGIRDPFALG